MKRETNTYNMQFLTQTLCENSHAVTQAKCALRYCKYRLYI